MSSTGMGSTGMGSPEVGGTGSAGTTGTTGTGSSGSTTEEAKAQASNLAGATRDEAASVAEDAKTQVRNVMDDARTMVDDQTRTQRDRVVETARSFSGDLEKMADSGPEGMAGDVTRQVAQKIRSVSEQLDGREPTDILEDVRSFARRRPGLFLLGALGAGVVVGRMARGAKDAQSSSSSSMDTSRTSSSVTSGSATTRTAYDPVVPSAGAPAADAGTGMPAGGSSSRPHGDPVTTTNDPFEQSDTPLGDEARRAL